MTFFRPKVSFGFNNQRSGVAGLCIVINLIIQRLNQLSHSIAGIAHALTEIPRFLHDIRETERESELLERMEAKAVGEIPGRIDIMERLKISKETYERYVADRHLNPSEAETQQEV